MAKIYTKSAYGTHDVPNKTAIRIFLVEYHDPLVMTICTMNMAKMGILIEIDTKPAFGPLNMHNKAAMSRFAVEYHDPPVMTIWP